MKLQPIILQIKENFKKGIDIENSIYMLMMNTLIYTFTEIDIKFFTQPNKNYKQRCIKFIEDVKKLQLNVDLTPIYERYHCDNPTDDGFEDSEDEKLNFFNKENTIAQVNKVRKPNIYEDSLIQSLLGHLHEKEELLKKKFSYRKHNPENFREYIDQTSPYELWKIIQDIKGGYYFFEVFENQKPETGINYQCIDRMLMCSKVYEREYGQFKQHFLQQQELHSQQMKHEISKLNAVEIKQVSEPICLILKEEPDIECNCSQRGARLALKYWCLVSQFSKCVNKINNGNVSEKQFKEYFQVVIINLESHYQQILQQYDQLQRINEILKSKLTSLRIIHQQFWQEQQNLTKIQRNQEDEIMKLKLQIQKIQLEKAQLITKYTNTENALLKIREFSDKNNIVNKSRLVAETLENLEQNNNQASKIFKLQNQSQFIQTDEQLDYQLCCICKGEGNLFQNIQQLRIPTIQFEKLELSQSGNNLVSKYLLDKSTQTEAKFTPYSQKYDYQRIPQSQNIQKRRAASISHNLVNENSIIYKPSKSQPKSNSVITPVFKRLFDDSQNKKVRQLQLTSRFQDEERIQWEEILQLLNKLSSDKNNQQIRQKIEKSIESYREQFSNRDKLPQLKLKEKVKVSEHLIDSLMKELQENKKVALNDLIEQFKSILTVNKLNKSRDMYNKITL